MAVRRVIENYVLYPLKYHVRSVHQHDLYALFVCLLLSPYTYCTVAGWTQKTPVYKTGTDEMDPTTVFQGIQHSISQQVALLQIPSAIHPVQMLMPLICSI